MHTVKDETADVNFLYITKPAGAKWTKVKSSTVKKSSSSSEPTVTMLAQVTGKRGTMKRRRQLQQLIDFQQQQLDMDLFSSTPFRANKQITVLLHLSVTAVFIFLEFNLVLMFQLS